MALGGSSGGARMFCSGWLSIGPRHRAGRFRVVLAVSPTLAPEPQEEEQQTSGTEFDEPRNGQRGTLPCPAMRC